MIVALPANEVSWEDLQTVFGKRGEAAQCQCQRYKIRHVEWFNHTLADRKHRLREQTDCGYPGSGTTSGLVAFLDDEPVGWCAVEPRTEYPRLLDTRVPWLDRDEDVKDAGVWAVTCFFTRAGYRRRGVSGALAHAAVEFARKAGARALEGYPMLTSEGRDVPWGELHVGSRSIFVEAGFREIAKPTPRRVVMRIDF
ncbi:GNAT family N-acetyltransferase [Streptosporangium canum]|uniref:GNAT family N-acetyltransferase n=1 Tax=Streptosporangium canum TaxID=324952 RepID=UPI00339F910A